MKSRQVLAVAAVSLMAVATVSACTSESDKTPEGNKSGQAAAQEATIAVPQVLNTIDPPQAIDSSSAQVINTVYEGLYRLNQKNQPTPADAAALPTVSKDGLTYTVRLNPKATWSNGDPVTAGDYAYAWKRAVGLPNASENQKYFTPIANADDIIAKKKAPDSLGVTAVDDHTLQITLRVPTSYFTSLLASTALFPVDQKYVTAQGEAFGSDSNHAVYNGPFVLADFAGPGIGGNWKYLKADHYWNASAVKLKTINVQVLTDTSTAVGLYKSGKVDEVQIAGAQVQANQSDPGYVASATSTSAFLGYNQTKPAFANQKVREAISLVINREALAKNVLADGSTAATGLVPPGVASYNGQDFAGRTALPTDIAKAKTLWAQAQKELGISSLTIDLETFSSDRVKIVSQYLQGAIQDNLPGIKVNVGINPTANLLDKVGKGQFDIYFVTWAAGYADPSSQLNLFLSSAGTNWGKYDDPSYDNALNAAATTDALDPAARWKDLQTAQQTLMADQGVTPIYFQSSTILRNPKFKGVVFHPVGVALDYTSAWMAN